MEIVNEGTTRDVIVNFVDKDGLPISPETCNYKIIDLNSGTEVKAETPVTIEEGETFKEIKINDEENVIINSENVLEGRKIFFEWSWNGSTEENNDEFYYLVKNLTPSSSYLCNVVDVIVEGEDPELEDGNLDDKIISRIPKATMQVYQDSHRSSFSTDEDIFNSKQACIFLVLEWLEDKGLISPMDDGKINSIGDGVFNVSLNTSEAEPNPKGYGDLYKYHLSFLKRRRPAHGSMGRHRGRRY